MKDIPYKMKLHTNFDSALRVAESNELKMPPQI